MRMLPVSSYYLVRMICSPISCDFSLGILSLLLYNVFCQQSPNEICTMVVQIFLVFPECPGLAALLSLASVVEKQRQSVFTIQCPIRSPVLLTLRNVNLFVNFANTVYECLQFQSQVKPAHSTCQEAEASQQCVLNSNSDDILQSSHGLI